MISFDLIHGNLLIDVADFFDLLLLWSTNQIPTRYSDNVNNANSVIDIIFLRPSSLEFDNYTIHPKFWYSSNHTSLMVDILIIEEFVPDKWYIIVKDSEKKNKIIFELIKTIKKVDTGHLIDKYSLELAVQEFAKKSDVIWYKYLECINITKHSKAWWKKDC